MNENYNPPFDDMTESERAVSDFLNLQGMWWQYEQPVFVKDDRNRPRVWSPDFYIPRLGIYVEVIGNNYANYDYRREVYNKNGVPIIFVYPNQDGWKDYLLSELIGIQRDRDELVKKFKRM